MKIQRLAISNFRGIKSLVADDLGDTIIVAGQNGSGKSCIFDAIRLLKSTYGGYQQNEYQQFFGEFQINLTGGSQNLRGLFNDSSKSCVIECDFKLRDREKAYIGQNASSLVEETVWQKELPEAFAYGGYRKAMFAAQFRDKQPEVAVKVAELLPKIAEELARGFIHARIEVHVDGRFLAIDSPLLSTIFTNYRPREIGVLDFHGAQRHYGRENVQGINLNLDQANQAFGNHALYNYNNKYNNVKSEMAGNFIKELLAEKAGSGVDGSAVSLTQTLTELFESFFPEKEFLGPQPTSDGILTFPVRTQSGQTHDLDELSSGEKEILYGYLRIRSSAPRDSIILLDEPELHLNPRLIRGLPEFYRRHLGEALQNQLWLVTHSDSLIREAIGKPGFNVYHMLPCGVDTDEEGQLKLLSVSSDLELLLADLVGDLAAYRPGGTGIIFEGGGDSEFDKRFVSSIFSEELRGVNLISGTNKDKVKVLHRVLQAAYEVGDLPTKFYAIVDKDSDDGAAATEAVNRFSWDVYHIENYLLDDEIISAVVGALVPTVASGADEIGKVLEVAARTTVDAAVTHRLRKEVNDKLVGSIDLGFSPTASDPILEMSEAINRSVARIDEAKSELLTIEALRAQESAIRQSVEAAFADGSWRRNLPGREILRAFRSLRGLPVTYDVFRNLIVSRMVELGHKPEGMKVIVDKVLGR